MLAWIGIASTLIAPAPQQSIQDGRDGRLNFVMTVYGAHSKIKKPAYSIVTSADEFAKVWAKHMGLSKPVKSGKQAPPQVDFSKNWVVAVFSGEMTNSGGVQFLSADLFGQVVRIRFDQMSYQTLGPNGGAVKSEPFGFAVIPRVGHTFQFEENVQSLKDQPPAWKLRSTVELLSKAPN